jgi:prepilin-type processing-associated H-X9-DG protein
MCIETKPSLTDSRPAFTRAELLACLCAFAVLTLVIASALATSGSRSERVACFNNLRQIGVAYGQFGLEHNDLVPWRVSTANGGNQNMIPAGLKNNLGIQFSAISNSLGTPKLLADPGDARPNLRVARHWGHASGGLRNPGYMNNAISYFLGLDGSFRVPSTVLSGDRNIAAQDGVGCSSGVQPAARVLLPIRWTNDVHGLAGNVVFFDGSAAQVDSKGLSNALSAGFPDNRDYSYLRGHLLLPTD